MFLRRIFLALVLEHIEGLNQPRARIRWHDDFINIAELSGLERVGKGLATASHAFPMARGSNYQHWQTAMQSFNKCIGAGFRTGCGDINIALLQFNC